MSAHNPPVQRVAISGASGLIGRALSEFLRARGDEAVHLVRRQPRAVHEIGWDPATRTLDPGLLSGVTAVVHLAGAGVGDHRWTPAYKHEILASRVDGTATIATALADLGEPIALVSGSAMGAYGDRGDEVLTEDSELGKGFLADVVRAWESATKPAQDAGLRVAHAGSREVNDGRDAGQRTGVECPRRGVPNDLVTGPWLAADQVHDLVSPGA